MAPAPDSTQRRPTRRAHFAPGCALLAPAALCLLLAPQAPAQGTIVEGLVAEQRPADWVVTGDPLAGSWLSTDPGSAPGTSDPTPDEWTQAVLETAAVVESLADHAPLAQWADSLEAGHRAAMLDGAAFLGHALERANLQDPVARLRAASALSKLHRKGYRPLRRPDAPSVAPQPIDVPALAQAELDALLPVALGAQRPDLDWQGDARRVAAAWITLAARQSPAHLAPLFEPHNDGLLDRLDLAQIFELIDEGEPEVTGDEKWELVEQELGSAGVAGWTLGQWDYDPAADPTGELMLVTAELLLALEEARLALGVNSEIEGMRNRGLDWLAIQIPAELPDSAADDAPTAATMAQSLRVHYAGLLAILRPNPAEPIVPPEDPEAVFSTQRAAMDSFGSYFGLDQASWEVPYAPSTTGTYEDATIYSAFHTAEAEKLLRPDLRIIASADDAVYTTPVDATPGFTYTFTVANSGFDDAAGIRVVAWDVPPAQRTGSTQPIAERLLEVADEPVTLPELETTEVTLLIPGWPERLFLEVDPRREIAEVVEWNNEIEVEAPARGPDLAIAEAGMSVAPASGGFLQVGSAAKLTMDIHNLGAATATDVTLDLSIGGELITTPTFLEDITPAGKVTIGNSGEDFVLPYSFPRPGQYTLVAEVKSGGAIPELAFHNNIATKHFTVFEQGFDPEADRPDLAIIPAGVATAASVLSGVPGMGSYVVVNQGTLAASHVEVEILIDDALAAFHVIPGGLAEGETRLVDLPLISGEMPRKMQLCVDPRGLVLEGFRGEALAVEAGEANNCVTVEMRPAWFPAVPIKDVEIMGGFLASDLTGHGISGALHSFHAIPPDGLSVTEDEKWLFGVHLEAQKVPTPEGGVASPIAKTVLVLVPQVTLATWTFPGDQSREGDEFAVGNVFTTASPGWYDIVAEVLKVTPVPPSSLSYTPIADASPLNNKAYAFIHHLGGGVKPNFVISNPSVANAVDGSVEATGASALVDISFDLDLVLEGAIDPEYEAPITTTVRIQNATSGEFFVNWAGELDRQAGPQRILVEDVQVPVGVTSLLLIVDPLGNYLETNESDNFVEVACAVVPSGNVTQPVFEIDDHRVAFTHIPEVVDQEGTVLTSTRWVASVPVQNNGGTSFDTALRHQVVADAGAGLPPVELTPDVAGRSKALLFWEEGTPMDASADFFLRLKTLVQPDGTPVQVDEVTIVGAPRTAGQLATIQDGWAVLEWYYAHADGTPRTLGSHEARFLRVESDVPLLDDEPVILYAPSGDQMAWHLATVPDPPPGIAVRAITPQGRFPVEVPEPAQEPTCPQFEILHDGVVVTGDEILEADPNRVTGAGTDLQLMVPPTPEKWTYMVNGLFVAESSTEWQVHDLEARYGQNQIEAYSVTTLGPGVHTCSSQFLVSPGFNVSLPPGSLQIEYLENDTTLPIVLDPASISAIPAGSRFRLLAQLACDGVPPSEGTAARVTFEVAMNAGVLGLCPELEAQSFATVWTMPLQTGGSELVASHASFVDSGLAFLDWGFAYCEHIDGLHLRVEAVALDGSVELSETIYTDNILESQHFKCAEAVDIIFVLDKSHSMEEIFIPAVGGMPSISRHDWALELLKRLALSVSGENVRIGVVAHGGMVLVPPFLPSPDPDASPYFSGVVIPLLSADEVHTQLRDPTPALQARLNATGSGTAAHLGLRTAASVLEAESASDSRRLVVYIGDSLASDILGVVDGTSAMGEAKRIQSDVGADLFCLTVNEWVYENGNIGLVCRSFGSEHLVSPVGSYGAEGPFSFYPFGSLTFDGDWTGVEISKGNDSSIVAQPTGGDNDISDPGWFSGATLVGLPQIISNEEHLSSLQATDQVEFAFEEPVFAILYVDIAHVNQYDENGELSGTIEVAPDWLVGANSLWAPATRFGLFGYQDFLALPINAAVPPQSDNDYWWGLLSRGLAEWPLSPGSPQSDRRLYSTTLLPKQPLVLGGGVDLASVFLYGIPGDGVRQHYWSLAHSDVSTKEILESIQAVLCDGPQNFSNVEFQVRISEDSPWRGSVDHPLIEINGVHLPPIDNNLYGIQAWVDLPAEVYTSALGASISYPPTSVSFCLLPGNAALPSPSDEVWISVDVAEFSGGSRVSLPTEWLNDYDPNLTEIVVYAYLPEWPSVIRSDRMPFAHDYIQLELDAPVPLGQHATYFDDEGVRHITLDYVAGEPDPTRLMRHVLRYLNGKLGPDYPVELEFQSSIGSSGLIAPPGAESDFDLSGGTLSYTWTAPLDHEGEHESTEFMLRHQHPGPVDGQVLEAGGIVSLRARFTADQEPPEPDATASRDFVIVHRWLYQGVSVTDTNVTYNPVTASLDVEATVSRGVHREEYFYPHEQVEVGLFFGHRGPDAEGAETGGTLYDSQLVVWGGDEVTRTVDFSIPLARINEIPRLNEDGTEGYAAAPRRFTIVADPRRELREYRGSIPEGEPPEQIAGGHGGGPVGEEPTGWAAVYNGRSDNFFYLPIPDELDLTPTFLDSPQLAEPSDGETLPVLHPSRSASFSATIAHDLQSLSFQDSDSASSVVRLWLGEPYGDASRILAEGVAEFERTNPAPVQHAFESVDLSGFRGEGMLAVEVDPLRHLAARPGGNALASTQIAKGAGVRFAGFQPAAGVAGSRGDWLASVFVPSGEGTTRSLQLLAQFDSAGMIVEQAFVPEEDLELLLVVSTKRDLADSGYLHRPVQFHAGDRIALTSYARQAYDDAGNLGGTLTPDQLRTLPVALPDYAYWGMAPGESLCVWIAEDGSTYFAAEPEGLGLDGTTEAEGALSLHDYTVGGSGSGPAPHPDLHDYRIREPQVAAIDRFGAVAETDEGNNMLRLPIQAVEETDTDFAITARIVGSADGLTATVASGDTVTVQADVQNLGGRTGGTPYIELDSLDASGQRTDDLLDEGYTPFLGEWHPGETRSLDLQFAPLVGGIIDMRAFLSSLHENGVLNRESETLTVTVDADATIEVTVGVEGETSVPVTVEWAWDRSNEGTGLLFLVREVGEDTELIELKEDVTWRPVFETMLMDGVGGLTLPFGNTPPGLYRIRGELRDKDGGVLRASALSTPFTVPEGAIVPGAAISSSKVVYSLGSKVYLDVRASRLDSVPEISTWDVELKIARAGEAQGTTLLQKPVILTAGGAFYAERVGHVVSEPGEYEATFTVRSSTYPYSVLTDASCTFLVECGSALPLVATAFEQEGTGDPVLYTTSGEAQVVWTALAGDTASMRVRTGAPSVLPMWQNLMPNAAFKVPAGTGAQGWTGGEHLVVEPDSSYLAVPAITGGAATSPRVAVHPVSPYTFSLEGGVVQGGNLSVAIRELNASGTLLATRELGALQVLGASPTSVDLGSTVTVDYGRADVTFVTGPLTRAIEVVLSSSDPFVLGRVQVTASEAGMPIAPEAQGRPNLLANPGLDLPAVEASFLAGPLVSGAISPVAGWDVEGTVSFNAASSSTLGSFTAVEVDNSSELAVIEQSMVPIPPGVDLRLSTIYQGSPSFRLEFFQGLDLAGVWDPDPSPPADPPDWAAWSSSVIQVPALADRVAIRVEEDGDTLNVARLSLSPVGFDEGWSGWIPFPSGGTLDGAPLPATDSLVRLPAAAINLCGASAPMTAFVLTRDADGDGDADRLPPSGSIVVSGAATTAPALFDGDPATGLTLAAGETLSVELRASSTLEALRVRGDLATGAPTVKLFARLEPGPFAHEFLLAESSVSTFGDVFLSLGQSAESWRIEVQAPGHPVSLHEVEAIGTLSTADLSVLVDGTLPTITWNDDTEPVGGTDYPKPSKVGETLQFAVAIQDANVEGVHSGIDFSDPASVTIDLDPAYSGTVNYDAGLGKLVLGPAPGGIWPDGAYTATISAMDRAGNSVVSVQPILIDTTPPVIACPVEGSYVILSCEPGSGDLGKTVAEVFGGYVSIAQGETITFQLEPVGGTPEDALTGSDILGDATWITGSEPVAVDLVAFDTFGNSSTPCRMYVLLAGSTSEVVRVVPDSSGSGAYLSTSAGGQLIQENGSYALGDVISGNTITAITYDYHLNVSNPIVGAKLWFYLHEGAAGDGSVRLQVLADYDPSAGDPLLTDPDKVKWEGLMDPNPSIPNPSSSYPRSPWEVTVPGGSSQWEQHIQCWSPSTGSPVGGWSLPVGSELRVVEFVLPDEAVAAVRHQLSSEGTGAVQVRLTQGPSWILGDQLEVQGAQSSNALYHSVLMFRLAGSECAPCGHDSTLNAPAPSGVPEVSFALSTIAGDEFSGTLREAALDRRGVAEAEIPVTPTTPGVRNITLREGHYASDVPAPSQPQGEERAILTFPVPSAWAGGVPNLESAELVLQRVSGTAWTTPSAISVELACGATSFVFGADEELDVEDFDVFVAGLDVVDKVAEPSPADNKTVTITFNRRGVAIIQDALRSGSKRVQLRLAKTDQNPITINVSGGDSQSAPVELRLYPAAPAQ